MALKNMDYKTDGSSLDNSVYLECKALCWLITISFFLLIALVIPVCAFFGLGKPVTIATAEWFNRSGALTSVFSLISGTLLNSYRVSYKGLGFSSVVKSGIYAKYRRYSRACQFVSVGFAILGSLIWGYGDYFLK